MSFLISVNYFDKRSDDLQCKKNTPNYYFVNLLYISNYDKHYEAFSNSAF